MKSAASPLCIPSGCIPRPVTIALVAISSAIIYLSVFSNFLIFLLFSDHLHMDNVCRKINNRKLEKFTRDSGFVEPRFAKEPVSFATDSDSVGGISLILVEEVSRVWFTA